MTTTFHTNSLISSKAENIVVDANLVCTKENGVEDALEGNHLYGTVLIGLEAPRRSNLEGTRSS